MRPISLLGSIAIAGVLATAALPAQEDGFVPLFNGKDLTGWHNINGARDTWTIRDGMVHCTGKPIAELRTERMYENFVLELEYQHQQAGGNAGVFVWTDALPARGEPFLRAIEVQVLDGQESANYTSHGDVFAIHGARLTPDRPHPNGWMRSLPSERRARPAGQWNHYRITANNGTIKLAVNGKEVSGGYDITPRKGYIALESEGAPVIFRHVRIKELPSSGTLRPDQIAQAHDGFVSLYDGVGFSGWKLPKQLGEWVSKDWIFAYEGKGQAADAYLSSEQSYGDFVLMVDWRVPKGTAANTDRAAPPPAGLRAVVVPRVSGDAPAGAWNRTVLTVKGNQTTVTVNGKPAVHTAEQPSTTRGAIALGAQGPTEFANVFIRTL